MGLGPSLSIRQSQQLVLTPQLRQAIQTLVPLEESQSGPFAILRSLIAVQFKDGMNRARRTLW